MTDEATIARIVSRVGDLPSMPEVVSKVLHLTDSPTATMAEVSETIESDPAMTAKILRVSNSSYYGMRQHVGTLKLALVILGVREVRNIVLGISVFDSLKDDRVEAAIVQDIWNNSLKVAALAKGLAKEMRFVAQGEEFVAGLLSDIGKLVLFRHFGTRYSEQHQAHRLDWKGLCAAESRLAGCTHADIAMALALRWNLPKSLVDALCLQYPRAEQPLSGAADPQLAAIVRVAKLTVCDGFEEGASLSALGDEECWPVLESVPEPIEEARRAPLLETLLEELGQLPAVPL